MIKMKNLQMAIMAGTLSFISCVSFSEPVRNDFDLDDDGLIEINDLGDLNEIRNNINGKTLYGQSVGCPASGCIGFELTSDLDFDTNGDGLADSLDDFWNEGKGWLPLPFNSSSNVVFDGNGHTLYNLFINRPSGNNGLFGYVYLAQLRNINIVNSVVSSPMVSSTGILAGSIRDSDVINGSFSGTVSSGGSYTGGVVGYSFDSTITDVSFSGSVSGNSGTGGVAGYIRGTQILRAYSSGQLTATGEGTGGVIGNIYGLSSLEDCSSSMQVSGSGHLGGLVGKIQSSSNVIRRCSATGNVAGTLSSVGGLIGSGYGVTITASYTTGNVTTLGSWNGGLAGTLVNSVVTESYATGDATGKYRVGGLVGYAANTQVSYSFSIGDVYVTDPNDIPNSFTNGYSGGFIGDAQNTAIIACYSTGSVLPGNGVDRIDSYAGSFIGVMSSGSSIRASYTVGYAYDEDEEDSGLTGWSDLSNFDIESTYWSVGSAQPYLGGFSMITLQCPTAENSTSCSASSSVLYENWGIYTYQNEDGVTVPYWDFGTSSQLPGLNIGGVVYRDNNADGVLDMFQ